MASLVANEAPVQQAPGADGRLPISKRLRGKVEMAAPGRASARSVGVQHGALSSHVGGGRASPLETCPQTQRGLVGV